VRYRSEARAADPNAPFALRERAQSDIDTIARATITIAPLKTY